MIFSQGHRNARKQNLLFQLSHKVFNEFVWNLAYCWDFFMWWNAYSFCLIYLVFKGENPTCVILLKRNRERERERERERFFQTLYNGRDHKVLYFDISLNDLDFHSRSQLFDNPKTSVYIFMEISQLILMDFSMWPQPVGLLKPWLYLSCVNNIERRELCWWWFCEIYDLHRTVSGH